LFADDPARGQFIGYDGKGEAAGHKCDSSCGSCGSLCGLEHNWPLETRRPAEKRIRARRCL